MQPTACTLRKLKGDMAGEEQKIEPGRQLSPEILEIIVPALKVGGISGMSVPLIESDLIPRDGELKEWCRCIWALCGKLCRSNTL
jgi:hypothetical protein